YSPENVAVKSPGVTLGLVDKFGYTNLGAGFGISSTYMKDPYYIYGVTSNANAIQCYSGSVTTSSGVVTGFTPTYGVATAEWNMVAGPRHALRLVDAGMDSAGSSYLPPTNGVLANGNGFT